MSINSHINNTNNANLLSEMAGNENSPSVGLDLYNEASFHFKIFLYALPEIYKNERTTFLQASYNSEEPQLAGSLSSTSGGGGVGLDYS